MAVVKGDEVIVISGDDRGKRGKVLKVFPEKKRVIVEGVNFVKRHTRPTRSMPQGGIVDKEAPVHISNVMLVDPKGGAGTRLGSKKMPDGHRVRVARKSGEIIPRPKES